ncbi:PilZ domain-containing protein [Candidatus Igneacidithiobacillus taiwanensis]|uniref:PilZ domain-containing protein n=1 Tax=Candidatus Igneacidithiobacillus taiwanensis TaxID=1945924 RepID=UPI00289C51C1|nr:PilZ domain-containing protein [Candidatus Igneacidithiobacillus taiwanensis]
MLQAGVVLGAHLPVEMRSWSGEKEEFSALMRNNLVLLRALSTWEEEALIADEGERSGQRHLQTKIDLLLTLLSADILARSTLPPRNFCELRTDALQVHSAADPAFAGYPCAALYLQTHLALPLLLPGQEVEVIASGDRAPSWILRFTLSAGVQEMLDRLIFRHHRRAIARLREAEARGKTRGSGWTA